MQFLNSNHAGMENEMIDKTEPEYNCMIRQNYNEQMQVKLERQTKCGLKTRSENYVISLLCAQVTTQDYGYVYEHLSY